MFQWEQFLKDYRIGYEIGGKNTKAGNVGLNCPLCKQAGDPDPSTHLGIDPKTGYFNCWRNSSHAGRNPVKLIRALIGCSNREAKSIVKDYDDRGSVQSSDPREFKSRVFNREEGHSKGKPASIPVPKGVADIRSDRIRKKNKMYINYLDWQRRMVDIVGILSRKESLNYPIWAGYKGPWKRRILFPAIENGNVKSWTARTISHSEKVRYKSVPRDKDRAAELGCEPAIEPITNCLYLPTNVPETGTIMVVCEGALDALKLYVGFEILADVEPQYRRYIFMPTCIFGLEVSRRQKRMLKELSMRFEDSYFLLDKKAESERMRMKLTFGDFLKECPIELPDYADDPGDLFSYSRIRRPDAVDFVKEIIHADE